MKQNLTAKDVIIKPSTKIELQSSLIQIPKHFKKPKTEIGWRLLEWRLYRRSKKARNKYGKR